MDTFISFKDKQHKITAEGQTTIIGERINPTRRKVLTEELVQGRLDTIISDALAQKRAGAHLLDVNVGTPLVNEEVMLPKVVKEVSQIAELPICIDSTNAKAIQKALNFYDGKALVNSVTGEESSLREILPIIKDYGAAVIGLTLNDNGIPRDVKSRCRVAMKIVERATSIGIPTEDILIDPICMTVAVDSKAALVTLATIEKLSQENQINILLGASNVSFGLPARTPVNAAFLAMAIYCGATAVITDPTNSQIKEAILAADVLKGRDSNGLNYIKNFRTKNQS